MNDYLKDLFIDEVKNLGKGGSGGIGVTKPNEPNLQLVTDEMLALKWEEKPFYKSNLIVTEVEGYQDYFTEIGNEITKFYGDTSVNWNFTFDGVSWSTPMRRLPINIGYPVEGVVDFLYMYQENGNVMVHISFTKGGKHVVTFERLEPKYKTIDECFLPDTVATKAYVEELIGGIENGTY